MANLVFSHANSFPASTYNVLFQRWRALGWQVHAIDKIGHDLRYPVSNNWPHLVKQLQSFLHGVLQLHAEPVYLVGHSLGGLLSYMLACRSPQLVSGVVLLDAPLIGGWRAHVLNLAKITRLAQRLGPGAISRKRRQQWQDVDAALRHFESKPLFAKWQPQVLRDYVLNGTHTEHGHEGSHRRLSFARDVETAIYNNLPSNLPRLMRHSPPQCPVSFIGGSASLEVKRAGLALTRIATQGRMVEVPGDHLFPMAYPVQTADQVHHCLIEMQGISPATAPSHPTQ